MSQLNYVDPDIECIVCYNMYDEVTQKIPTCVNHNCCKSCYLLINNKKCPYCRQLLIFAIPYGEQLKINLTDKLHTFLNKFLTYNFLRSNKEFIFKYFTIDELLSFSNIKMNQKYIIFRGLKNKANTQTFYNDEYISSWTLDINIAKKFGEHIYCIEIDPMYVFIDMNFLYKDIHAHSSLYNEKEIIVFQGEYPIKSYIHNYISSTYTSTYDSIVKTINDENFTIYKIPVLLPNQLNQFNKCEGITLKGKQCSKNKKFGYNFCHLHLPNTQTNIIDINMKCNGITLKGLQCSKNKKKGENFCAIHCKNTNKHENCLANTKKGTQCSFKALKFSKSQNINPDFNLDYCTIHNKKLLS
jgi:hypothetical protein